MAYQPYQIMKRVMDLHEGFPKTRMNGRAARRIQRLDSISEALGCVHPPCVVTDDFRYGSSLNRRGTIPQLRRLIAGARGPLLPVRGVPQRRHDSVKPRDVCGKLMMSVPLPELRLLG